MTEYHWQCLQGLWKESPPNHGFALVLLQITGVNVYLFDVFGMINEVQTNLHFEEKW